MSLNSDYLLRLIVFICNPTRLDNNLFFYAAATSCLFSDAGYSFATQTSKGDHH